MLECYSNNQIDIYEKINISGKVRGENNVISIRPSDSLDLTLHVNGSNNVVEIERGFRAARLAIYIGNHVPAHGVTLRIGESSSAEPDCRFYLYNSGNSLRIGRSCMLSNSIIIRTGESPHLIFDDETGGYLDVEGNVAIGDHCWIGERAYITKRAILPNDTIVAACAVVTRAFTEGKTMIAGNPAVVKRRAVRWVRNATMLEPGSLAKDSYDAFVRKFEPSV